MRTHNFFLESFSQFLWWSYRALEIVEIKTYAAAVTTGETTGLTFKYVNTVMLFSVDSFDETVENGNLSVSKR